MGTNPHRYSLNAVPVADPTKVHLPSDIMKSKGGNQNDRNAAGHLDPPREHE